MAGSDGQVLRAATLMAVVGIACTGVLAPPVTAVDEVGPIVLPGETTAVLAADIDGDGAAEVVRIAVDSDLSGHVEAWDIVEGSWDLIGSIALPASESGADAGLGPPAALLRTLVDGRDRLLVIVAAVDPDDAFRQACCAEFHELTSSRRGIALAPMGTAGGPADSVVTADFDADGTDELVLRHSRYDEEAQVTDATATVRTEVLRRGTDGWSTIYASEEVGLDYGVTVGESDGVPGDEMLFGPAEFGELRRLTLIGGRFVSDMTTVAQSEDGGGWIGGITEGRLVVTYPDALEVIRWPRGMAAEGAARLSSRSWPSATVVGDGRDAVIVKHDGFDLRDGGPRTTIHDFDLQLLDEVEASPLAAELWDLIDRQGARGGYSGDRDIWPMLGPVPGGWVDGSPAYAAGGSLIRIEGAGGVAVSPMATLMGSQILGLAGPDRAWALIGTSIFAPANGAYLYGGVAFGQSMAALTPVDALLKVDGDADLASFELRYAVEVPGDGRDPNLIAHADGFEISVTAPAQSAIVSTDGSRWESQVVDTEPVLISANPRPGRREENQEFERWVVVIRPDGIGSIRRWQGTFLREPPDVTAHAVTGAFSLRSTIVGRVSDGMSVTVDGVPAVPNRSGAFRVEVDAPIWPRSVKIVARDPFGTERTARVEIVGFLDYRGLPWVPIVAILTVVVGGVLFVRTPRHRPHAVAVDGDGQLEEISAD